MNQNNRTLYHGSKTPNLKALRPNPSKLLDGKPVVFAPPDIRFALSMIHGNGDDLDIGYFVNNETGEEEMYIRELKPRKIKLLELPGYLYEVENLDFYTDSRLSHVELISDFEVKVTKTSIIKNILLEIEKYPIRIITKN
jgi:hypothetical protein